MADIGEEQEWAEGFAQHMDEYLSVFSDQLFPILVEREVAFQRAEDKAMIIKVKADVGEVYAVMADGIINRNLDETIAAFNTVKEMAAEDISTVQGLADTDEEKRFAREFEIYFTEYLSMFEDDVIPVLRQESSNMGQIRALDEELDGFRNETIDILHRMVILLEEDAAEAKADEVEIRRLDGEIDVPQKGAAEPLNKIVALMKAEMIKVKELFDVMGRRTTIIVVIISIIAIIITVMLAVMIILGITNQKTAEKTLQKEKERAQKYLDVAGVMLVVISTDQYVKLINKKGCEILGYKEGEIIGKNWFDNFMPERLIKNVKNVFNDLMKGNIEPFEYYENPVLPKMGTRGSLHGIITFYGMTAVRSSAYTDLVRT